MKKQINYDVEVTDTFSGEANYSWVRRYVISSAGNPVKAAKKAAGWENLRCSKENYGDMTTLRPAGVCIIMFITYKED